jgi:hypothetical protein
MPDVREVAGGADEALGELLLLWQERRQRGEPADAEGLCAGRPELVRPLRERARALEAMEAALGLEGAPAPPSTESAGGGANGWGRPAPPAVPGHEVLGEVARGGMGVVYKARQFVGAGPARPHRLVAVKMILAGPLAGPDRLARFRTEVGAAARLAHPNVVQVFQVGDCAGQPYFTMELLEGGSLAARLARGLMPAREAARLVRTLAEAVQHAHERGIVHRDLKPANVLLAADGTPKVTDFGLAKVLGEGSEAGGATYSGAVLGTPCYLAPEQAEGRPREVGPAADVYALGAILYECLTGRPPFQGETTLDTLEQVRRREPLPPRQLQPKVDRDLETICLQCLRKEPGRRYARAADLAADLGRFLEGRPVAARPVPAWARAGKWLRRQPALAALLLVSVLALGAVLGVWAGFTARLADERDRARAEENKALAKEQEAREQKALAEAERGEAEQQRRRAELILMRCGDAVKTLVKNTRAVKVEARWEGGGSLFYAMSRYYAAASARFAQDKALSAKDRERLAGEYAARAVELLECALADDYFASEANRRRLAEDPDLAPLRGREEFEQLVRRVRK